MGSNKLIDFLWYIDSAAIEKNEPGIYHSYLRGVASALNYLNKNLDPVWLMGGSGFAFRIFANETLCPSAMSMFSFKDVLPEVIKQSGYECTYLERMWNETDKEEEMRIEAHHAIITGIDKGIPAIVWDVSDAEWGLIIGYNDREKSYIAMSYNGKQLLLPYNKLGKNGIEILSVCISGSPNHRNRDEIINNSLNAAVAHAEGKEFIDDRPKYQNGLEAYDLWVSVFEKWAWLIDAGKSERIGLDLPGFARYYAGHYYSARCYARDYLKLIANDNEHLQKASLAYGRVADFLKPLWGYFSEAKEPESKLIRTFARKIKKAKHFEEDGIELIKKYLH